MDETNLSWPHSLWHKVTRQLCWRKRRKQDKRSKGKQEKRSLSEPKLIQYWLQTEQELFCWSLLNTKWKINKMLTIPWTIPSKWWGHQVLLHWNPSFPESEMAANVRTRDIIWFYGKTVPRLVLSCFSDIKWPPHFWRQGAQQWSAYGHTRVYHHHSILWDKSTVFGKLLIIPGACTVL